MPFEPNPMAVSENTPTSPSEWSRSRQLFALIWLLGVLFFGLLALSPLRLPFLEYPLVGALSLDYVLHSLGFCLAGRRLSFAF